MRLLIKIGTLSQDMKCSNWLRNNDMFVRINYNNQMRDTTTKWNDKNPKWNEEFLLDHDENVSEITISLYDRDHWSKDDLLKTETGKISERNQNYIISNVNIVVKKVMLLSPNEYNNLLSSNRHLSLEVNTMQSTYNELHTKYKNNELKNNNLQCKIKKFIQDIEDHV